MIPSFWVAAYMASVGRNALSYWRAPVWAASCVGRGLCVTSFWPGCTREMLLLRTSCACVHAHMCV